jgi:polyribonucleotide nucleotidyltransferase
VTIIEKKFELGGRQVTLQTGLLAKQTRSSVFVDIEGTSVLVTLCTNSVSEDKGFFPFSVHYHERAYAYGTIPGGFKKREGPPSEREALTSRLIDRPLRPLFHDEYQDEVQIIALLMSRNQEVQPDIPAMIGAAAALEMANLPVLGTMGAVRIGLNEHNEFVINPSEKSSSALDLVVAGTSDSIMMVESQAEQVSEELMIDALNLAQKEICKVIEGIKSFVQLAPKVEPISLDLTHPLVTDAQVDTLLAEHPIWKGLTEDSSTKASRSSFISETTQSLIDKLAQQEELTNEHHPILRKIIGKRLKSFLRKQIVTTSKRLDGRDHSQVRSIDCQTQILKGAHGSSLFTRGETQSLGVVTLGTGRDYQIVDNYGSDEKKEYFMLHYNFPPFCVGEVGMMGSPKRREIGHGKLAYKAITPLLPSLDEFSYVVRCVSEVLESNGSSSMATVCSTSLALMDAGVPLKAPVAGIAMGLIKEDENYAILSDISGEEDHFGDMDFKVAGTSQGITALQMDIKIAGLSLEVMKKALHQAKEGRLHILGVMNEHLSTARSSLANHAPHIEIVKVRADKVRDVIGKGGSTIKMLAEKSGATVDVNDDGTVTIVSHSKESAALAKELLDQVVKPLVVGQIYSAQVSKILEFGFVVTTLTGQDGLVHISECPFDADEMQERIAPGQKLDVKLIHFERHSGRYKFSLLAEESQSVS